MTFFFTFSDSNYSVAKNVKLDSFSRIIKGDSLRIDKMVPAETYPPARILDLSAFVIKGQKISKAMFPQYEGKDLTNGLKEV